MSPAAVGSLAVPSAIVANWLPSLSSHACSLAKLPMALPFEFSWQAKMTLLSCRSP